MYKLNSMKKNNYKILLVISILLISSFVTMSFLYNQQQPSIEGTWILESDLNRKTVFTTNGVKKDYHQNVLIGTYEYTITKSCGIQTLPNNNDEYFIKYTNNELFTWCSYINNINTDNNGEVTLSITSETGKLFIYTKQ